MAHADRAPILAHPHQLPLDVLDQVSLPPSHLPILNSSEVAEGADV